MESIEGIKRADFEMGMFLVHSGKAGAVWRVDKWKVRAVVAGGECVPRHW